MGQLHQHDPVGRVSVHVNGGAHVQHIVYPAGQDQRRAFALELGDHQPCQLAGVGQGDSAGCGYRSRPAAQHYWRIGGRQAFAAQE